jgi:hypothetical protein
MSLSTAPDIALTAGSNVTFVAAVPVISLNAIPLNWTPSVDGGVIGYRVYFQDLSATNLQSADVGNVTKCTISDLRVGSTYQFWCVALHVLGVQSRSSNVIILTVPASTGMRVSEYVIESFGGFGMTNSLRRSFDLKTWTEVLRWKGDGQLRQYHHVPTNSAFFQTVPI